MSLNTLEQINYGTINKNLLDWWTKELPNLNPVEFSSLRPFVRLTPVVVVGETIVDHNKSIHIDFSNQLLNKQNLKGDFGLKSLNLEVAGEMGSIFKINLELDVYDLDILEKNSSKPGLYELTKLNNIIKVEFGWSRYAWNKGNYSSIKEAGNHYGKGFELFALITLADTQISQTISSVSIKMVSVGNTIMNNYTLSMLFDFKADELTQTAPNSFVAKKVLLDKAAGRTVNDDGTTVIEPAVSLRRLLDQLTKSIKENISFLGITSISVPSFDTSPPLTNIKGIFPALQDTIGIDSDVEKPTVGDFMIAVDEVIRIKNQSNTPKAFVSGLCESINGALTGAVNLKLFAIPPSGTDYIIVNQADPNNSYDNEEEIIDNKNIVSGKDKYLPIIFNTGNSLVEEISFESNLSDGGKNIQIAVEMGNIKGSTPKDLINFVRRWYDQDNLIDPNKAKELIDSTPGTPRSILKQLVAINPKIREEGQLTKAYNELKEISRNITIADNAMKYIPYNMSLKILGLSDIWWGARLYLDNNCPIPWVRESVWRVTTVSHELTPGNWKTSMTCVCEYNKSVERAVFDSETKTENEYLGPAF